MTATEILKQTNGKFTNVTFVRSTDTKSGKAGELSTRVFRTKVTKGVKGVGMSYDPAEKGLVVLYSVKDKCHRTIKIANITRIKCGQLDYSKVDGQLVINPSPFKK
jgi:hypothetical protein